MGKGKLERFEEVAAFENTLELSDFQDGQTAKPKGKWNSRIFGNDNPITLELACGKGDYTLELARQHPNKNFVGVDIKGARIWKGAKRALKEELGNVRFLRIYIDHLDEYFAPREINDIWITFPDPYPKGSNKTKRLISPKFLNIYQKVLRPGKPVRLKTDSDSLFSYTRKVVRGTGCSVSEIVENIYQECPDNELLTIKTDYENRHLERGRSISYIKFSLPEKPILA